MAMLEEDLFPYNRKVKIDTERIIPSPPTLLDRRSPENTIGFLDINAFPH